MNRTDDTHKIYFEGVFNVREDYSKEQIDELFDWMIKQLDAEDIDELWVKKLSAEDKDGN